MKGYSKSIWNCPDCNREEEYTYADIDENGIPFCGDCDETMVFVSESWSELTINDILKED